MSTPIAPSDETMEPHIRNAVTEMVAQNHAAAGDYAIMLHAVVLDDGATVYEWRWYWTPRVRGVRGKIG